jgi:hypothetical protein
MSAVEDGKLKIEGWKAEALARWKVGRMEGWKGGRMEG